MSLVPIAAQIDPSVAEITAGMQTLDISEKNKSIKAQKEASRSHWDRRLPLQLKAHIASFLDAKSLARFQLVEACLRQVSFTQNIYLDEAVAGKFLREFSKNKENAEYLKRFAAQVVFLSPYFKKRAETERAFAEALPSFTSLQTLGLADVGTGAEPSQYLSRLPASVKRLRYDCITDDQLKALATIPTLDQLDIELPLLGAPIIPHLADADRDVLRIAARVTVLSAVRFRDRYGQVECFELDQMVRVLPYFKNLRELIDCESYFSDVAIRLLKESPENGVIEFAKKVDFIATVGKERDVEGEKRQKKVIAFFEGLKTFKVGGPEKGAFFGALPLGLERLMHSRETEPTLIADENLQKLGRLCNLRVLEIKSRCLQFEWETLKALPKSLERVHIQSPLIENADEKAKFLRARGVITVDICKE